MASFACAQDVDSLRTRAHTSLNEGRYDDARRHYQSLLEQDTADAALGYAASFKATGEYERGLSEIDRRLRSSGSSAAVQAALHCARGRLLASIGQNEDAAEAFDAALRGNPEIWPCAADFAELLLVTGRWRDAGRLFAGLFERLERGDLRTARDLIAGARAAAAFGEFRDANNAYRTANEVDPRNVEVLYRWAELFREKYNDADARRTYEEALSINPRHAPSLVGLALASGNFERQEELANEALAINPNLTDALDLLAGLRILDGMYDEAERLALRALETNSLSITSLGQLASVYFLDGDETAFVGIEERAIRAAPRASDFYLTLAENATRRFRYPAAATFAERAVEVNFEDPRAHAELGTALLRLGRAAESRRHIEYAYEQDPFNLFAANTLTLLDTYEEFSLVESEHFRLMIHPDERDVLAPLILDMAEASFDSLSPRYPYEPDGKILLEAYNNADDFAVRIAGVPHAGLLGVSFGDVLAVNTPRAQSATFNWARTLWHEVAHTMAIGVSEHHVPRWLTEGLSVYEERRGRPEWGRELELAFLSAFAQNRLLPLEEIDRGFTRPTYPGQILLSYYHAGEVIRYIADEYGFDAIITMLQSLAEGSSQEDAVRSAVGMSRADLDQRFRAAVEQRRQALAPAFGSLAELRPSEDAEVDPDEGGQAPFFRALREGADHLSQSDYAGAETAFERALSQYPNYVGSGNAYAGLARIYRESNREDDLIDILTRYLEVAEDETAAAVELAQIFENRGDDSSAAAMLERSLHVKPYDAAVRGRLADVYDRMQYHGDAVSHRRAVVALDPSDAAGAYYRLARSLQADGQRNEARRAVLRSLEIAPDYRDAQRLLLEVVEER